MDQLTGMAFFGGGLPEANHESRTRPFTVVSFPGAIVIGCAMSAMNADGLILGQNDVGQAANGSPALDLRNTPTAVLTRRILEGCSTLEEARKLLNANKPASRSIF